MNARAASLIAGYEIERLIGSGGSGEVFAGVRTGPDGFRKPVALKRLHVSATLSDKKRERFLREARVAARLNHPNLVSVYALELASEGPVIVMELLDGSPLDALLAEVGRRAPLPWWVVLEIGRQALAGLAYAHTFRDEEGRPLGLVHRDITPRNVFVCRNGVVKILDFGLVALRDAGEKITESGVVYGVPHFMSPEQAEGSSDARSDIYQLGATLYFGLCGRPPYEGTDPDAVVEALLSREPTPLAKRRADLPPQVVLLVERALAREPSRRFQSAEDMRAAVDRLLESAPASGQEALERFIRNPSEPISGVSSVRTRTTPIAATPAAEEISLGSGITLERPLGSGGMARVYRGKDRKGLPVAIKILHQELAEHPECRERFLREAYAANRVNHPGAVRVLEHHATHDLAFLVMELVEGEALSALLRRSGRLEPRQVFRYAEQVLDVLAAAHAAGVIHRDITPSNLMLDDKAAVRILDFGLARIIDDLPSGFRTRTGTMLGTMHYMAPEQVSSEHGKVDAQTDVYGLGATLFRLLSGKPVHDYDNETEQLWMSANKSAPPLRSLAPDLHPDICAVVDRALAFSKSERYPDALTMLADVRAVLDGRKPPFASLTAERSLTVPGGPSASALRAQAEAPTLAVVPPAIVIPPAPMSTPSPRWPWLLGAIGFGLLLLFGLSALALYRIVSSAEVADSPSVAPIAIDVDALDREYRQDSQKAAAKYQGKWLDVTGYAGTPKLGNNGKAYVTLVSKDALLSQAMCRMDSTELPRGVERGTPIKVRGKVTTRILMVVLDSCTIIR